MDIEEIKEENLDSPLVVHKKDDASYQEANTEVSMQNTHVDEDSDMPTLERHRFKKEKKKKKWPYVLCILIAILAVVLVVLLSNKSVLFSNCSSLGNGFDFFTSEKIDCSQLLFSSL